ncbi:hypothetical protein ACEQ8H_005755 [Pleosporales sp. CAS-2024a]
MASATPSPAPALPKSKTGAAPPATTTSDAPSPPAHTAADNPNFIHPHHVIPPPNYTAFHDLVIVCCHAIYLPHVHDQHFALKSPHDETNWLLAPFQRSNPDTRKPGEQSTFVAHAQAGLDALSMHPDRADLEQNLLILSGGRTRRNETDTSEARSYYHALLAEELHQNHLGGGKTHTLFAKGRILLEEHATDSLQNLLFSILLFRRTTGHYPRHVRLITHAFKARRFLALHATAIQWPPHAIQVQGIDPVMTRSELHHTLDGEERNGYALWAEDPLGAGDKLTAKRRQRGWSDRLVDELVDGLEEGVRELVLAKTPKRVPW